MERNQLEAILNDPASTAAEKAAAKAALGPPDLDAPQDLHPHTHALLNALQGSRVSDLTELAFERYHKIHQLGANDPLVREFWYWVVSPEYLRLLGMTEREWWEQGCEVAVADKRPDAEAFARTKLDELGE